MTHISPSRRTLSMLVVCAALAIPGAPAVDAQGTSFKSGVDMVPLTVTVTDANGKYVTGLTGQDFIVLENGVEQHLSFFACADVPLDLALVLDTSASMRADLPLVQAAALGLVHRLGASDRGAVFEVKDFARMPQPFTSDVSLIDRAIRGLSTSGETALYDGLYIALKEFERERRATAQVRRQALVVLSDGLDTRSHLPFDDVLDLARRAGVSIYTVVLQGDLALVPRNELDGSVLQADYAMRVVAGESGGRMFVPKFGTDLPAVYAAIAQELASQYELGYTPLSTAKDGAFRRVAVRVASEANARARTRSGYYAPKGGGVLTDDRAQR